MSSVTFTPSELGEASSIKPNTNGGPIQVWIRPTPNPGETVHNCWKEKFPEQTGFNKEGKLVPLRDFDIFDMLTGFLSSKEISILMENEKKNYKKKRQAREQKKRDGERGGRDILGGFLSKDDEKLLKSMDKILYTTSGNKPYKLSDLQKELIMASEERY